VNILIGAAVVAVVVVLTVTAMLLVRRGAPEGSRFQDGDRASGVFGVLATGFSVLLGFIVFLAFTTYDQARAGAEDESVIVAQQLQTAQFFDEPHRTELTGELVCYARNVAGVEWDQMEDGSLANSVNPWGVAMFQTVRDVDPAEGAEQSAYDRWMDETAARQQARNDRVHAVGGIVPSTLWIALLIISSIIFLFMLFFADRGEGAATQGVLMGSVAATITILLLLIVFFDNPYNGGLGSLQPDSMGRALVIMDEAMAAEDIQVTPPCDDEGRAVE
jgi:quinol-cytochrome oxidoreductase complex cytochrome b subunit